jgi:hypothetical protein
LTEARYILAEGRAVLMVGGADARSFLQGLVSNDVEAVTPTRAVYAALLTPQGRYLHDFFMLEIAGAIALDCEAPRRADLLSRLTRYRLRAKVTLADGSDNWAVALIFGPGAAEAFQLAGGPGAAQGHNGGVVYIDPRRPALGLRAILPRADPTAALAGLGLRPGTLEDYERLRLSLGVPDGSRDLPVEKAILLENGFDALNGIGWDKGCYVGQELTARTRYRGLVRKRLLPVTIEGPVPAWGTPVTRGGAEAGEMRTAMPGIGLAMLRLEFLESPAAGEWRADGALLTPVVTSPPTDFAEEKKQ